jgi:hypothetical protein
MLVIKALTYQINHRLNSNPAEVIRIFPEFHDFQVSRQK